MTITNLQFQYTKMFILIEHRKSVVLSFQNTTEVTAYSSKHFHVTSILGVLGCYACFYLKYCGVYQILSILDQQKLQISTNV